MIDRYDWAGGQEAMLRFGPSSGPVVVAALPLFEEANRTRTFTVTLLRLLAERGVAGALPDMPGQGESLMALETLGFLRIQEAFGGVVDHILDEGRAAYALGVRSGALLDAHALASGRWHLAPQDGSDLLRELKRVHGSPLPASAARVEIAGNLISADLLAELEGKQPFAESVTPRRVVRLESDPRPADHKVPGAPLWRRSEPDNDPALAALLADDIAAWVRACEG
ncbi:MULTISPECIES: hypothetical protein [unclassified Sphingomonas]|uniref:hypothetical protein n=1 Tax=unclassified Sphingomonas TaxID=196159 RepID=UPI0022B5AC41|nr:hypothetical protein [Sphingomonas sp. NIBR02145]WHU03305.1 hypothetical protein O3305_01460 [Sphingomonas sp. NIBR02145]